MRRTLTESVCDFSDWPDSNLNSVLGIELENGCEGVVTDFVEELSTGLQIPFLLGEGITTVNENGGNEPIACEFDAAYSFVGSPDSWSSVPLGSVKNEADMDLDIQEFIVKDELTTPADSSTSGTGSGSECSTSDIWTSRNDLDTPPVTPPDRTTLPEALFIYTTPGTNYIPQGMKPKVKHKDLHGTRKVRIQPKPNDVSFIVPETRLSQTCGVFSSSSSRSSPECVQLEAGCDVTAGKNSVLTREEAEKLQALRKRDRMIRNRESACLSRKKKKEHVALLEQQVENLTAENTFLRHENCLLRDKLTKYGEVLTPKRSYVSPLFKTSPKKTTALLAVMFTICLNIGSFGNLLLSRRAMDTDIGDPVGAVPEVGPRHTRSLLWTDGDLELTNVTQTSCPVHINQTESIRLESELRRWISSDEETVRAEKLNSSKINQYFDTATPASKPKRKAKHRFSRGQDLLQDVQLFAVKPHVYLFGSLFEGIHRREDTFYLVSFTGDHLLLPALAHNHTTRPKMSLMLPAASNSSTGQVEMMQIDCEVTNTQLLNMRQQAYGNTTSRPGMLPRHRRNTTKTRQGKTHNSTEYFMAGKETENEMLTYVAQDRSMKKGNDTLGLKNKQKTFTFFEMLRNNKQLRDFKVDNVFIGANINHPVSRK